MEIYRGFEAARGKLAGCAVALGNFDGVHKGHQALFARARELAAGRGSKPVVATFDPHPGKVLFPQLAPKLLTPLPRRLELFEALGIEAAVVQPFDAAYAAVDAETFLERDLFGALSPGDVVVGPDFTYGKARGGTVATLREACQRRSVGFVSVPPVTCEGVVVSSTKIREFVAEGRVTAAACLLDRPFELSGVVVRGLGRGRTLGYPTANVSPDLEVRPAFGVYAVRAFTEAGVFAGAANVGRKPTFGEEDATVEVHLFDFKGDLYGTQISLELLDRLRGEQRFAGPAELAAQIARDCERARELVAQARPPGPLSPRPGVRSRASAASGKKPGA